VSIGRNSDEAILAGARSPNYERPPAKPLLTGAQQVHEQEKADGTQSLLSAFLVSLTDIIEDMFPSLPAEDKHRIAVAKDAISDHQTGTEQDERQQHENQNPHHR